MRANSQLDSFRGFARMPLTVLYIRSSTRVMLPNYFHRLLISIIEIFSTIHALANLATRRDATRPGMLQHALCGTGLCRRRRSPTLAFFALSKIISTNAAALVVAW